MNCAQCNTPYPGFELIDGVCHRCTHRSLVRLQLDYDRLYLELETKQEKGQNDGKEMREEGKG